MPEPLWRLVQYVAPATASPRLAVWSAGALRALPDGWPETALELLESWSQYHEALVSLDPAALVPVDHGTLTAPITYPRKVICAGANFYSHAAEMGSAPPDPRREPFFFLKPPSTTVIGPDGTAPLPDGPEPQYDWEAELGVVIGRRGRRIAASRARGHVAGYVVANDLSARDRFARPFATAPFDWDWLAQKGQDGSCPMGPGVTPAWMVPDIDTARITLGVNGRSMQDGTMQDIVVPVDELVAAASTVVTLEPGDVILAGTPSGVGLPRRTFLRAGDVVEVSIDGLGTLRHFIGPPSEAGH